MGSGFGFSSRKRFDFCVRFFLSKKSRLRGSVFCSEARPLRIQIMDVSWRLSRKFGEFWVHHLKLARNHWKIGVKAVGKFEKFSVDAVLNEMGAVNFRLILLLQPLWYQPGEEYGVLLYSPFPFSPLHWRLCYYSMCMWTVMAHVI